MFGKHSAHRPYFIALALAAYAPGSDMAAAEKGDPPPSARQAAAETGLDLALIVGSWRITQLNGAAPKSRGDGVPFLNFGPIGYGGSSGCNFFGGLGVLEGGRYHTAPGAQSAMGCGDLGTQEQTITGMLGASPRMALNADGNLALSSGGKTMMLRRDPGLTAENAGAAAPPDPPLLAGTRWWIESIDGVRLVQRAGQSQTLRFEADSWSGRAGCATLSGGWRQEKDRILLSGGPATTEQLCPPQEASIDAKLAALMTARARFATGPNGEILIAGGGHWLVGARPRNQPVDDASLLAGGWQIVAIDGAAPMAGTRPALGFGAAGYGGTTGCNAIQGLFLAQDRRLFTEPGPQTEQGCGKMTRQEERITGLLAASPRIALTPQGEIALVDRSGALLLRRNGRVAVTAPRAIPFTGNILQAEITSIDGTSPRMRASDPESRLRLYGRDRWEMRGGCLTLGGVWRRRGGMFHFFTDPGPGGQGSCTGEHGRRSAVLMRLMNGAARIAIGPNGELLLAGDEHWLAGQVDRSSPARR